MSIKSGLFLRLTVLYHYSDFWYYRSFLYYGTLKKLGKNKSKLRTVYPKNLEIFKNSKPSVLFYWFL